MKAICAAIIAAVAVPALAAAQQPVLLQFNHQEGQVLRYRGQLTGTGHMTIEGQSQPLVVKGQFVLVQKVGAQKGDGYELTTTLEDARLSFRVGAEPEQSTSVTPPPLVQMITKSGRVLSEKGWAQSEPGAEKSPLHGTLKWLAAQMPRAGFPETEVQVNQTWTQDLTVPQSKEPARQVSTLKGFEKWPVRPTLKGRPHGPEGKELDCANVATAVTLPIEQWLPPDPIGTKVHIKGRQQLDTTLLFAHEKGLIARQQTTVVLHVDSEAHLRDVKEPVHATMDVTAKVNMELETARP